MILYNRDCHVGYLCGCSLWLQDSHDARRAHSLGSSSQAPTWSIGIVYEDEDDDEVDQRHEELDPSQLQDAPSTQPT